MKKFAQWIIRCLLGEGDTRKEDATVMEADDRYLGFEDPCAYYYDPCVCEDSILMLC